MTTIAGLPVSAAMRAPNRRSIPGPTDALVSTDYTARLELDLRVTDGLGRQLAQTKVDIGTVVFESGMGSRETPDLRCLKLTHQAAWQAAEQAARVAPEALLADRQRVRAL